MKTKKKKAKRKRKRKNPNPPHRFGEFKVRRGAMLSLRDWPYPLW